MAPCDRVKLINHLDSAVKVCKLALSYYCYKKEKRKRRQKKVWVRHYLVDRPTHGHYASLMKSLGEFDPELYRNFTRMTESVFDELIERLTPRLERKVTFWRKPLDVGLRVAITLREQVRSMVASVSLNTRDAGPVSAGRLGSLLQCCHVRLSVATRGRNCRATPTP